MRFAHSPGSPARTDGETELERAAILEFEAGQPRPWAELDAAPRGRFRVRTAEEWARWAGGRYQEELAELTRWKGVEMDKAAKELEADRKWLGSEAAAWSLGREEVTRRLERAEARYRAKLDAINRHVRDRLLKASKWFRKGDAFRMCRRVGFVRKHVTDTGCKAIEYTEFSCDIRGCELCGDRRVARLMDRYLPRIQAFLESSLAELHTVYELTITTVNHRKGVIPSAGYFAAFQRAISEFMKLYFSKHNRAALGSQELGFNNTNLHGHYLVFGEKRRPGQRWRDHPLDKDLLEIEWKRIARKHGINGGFIYIKESRDPSRALGHCLKYLAKPFTDDPVFFARVIYNTPEHFRTFRAWGWLSLKKTKGDYVQEMRDIERRIRAAGPRKPPEDRCPACGTRTELDGLDVRPIHELRAIGALTHAELLARGHPPPD